MVIPHPQPSNSLPQPTNSVRNCGKCSKRVCHRYCKIYCDTCLKYFHYKCSIKINEFELLQKQSIGWTCQPCRHNIFPFNIVESNDDFLNLYIDDPLKDLLLQKKKKCHSCTKTIKKSSPANNCSNCKKYFHLKCSEVPKKGISIPKDWTCCKCSISVLPFSTLDNNTLLLTQQGLSDTSIDGLNNVPSFSIKSLLDKMPGQHFSTDEFISDSIISKYVTAGEYLNQRKSKNNFSIFHLNIASIQKHIDELRTLLFGLKHKFKIICISETRLQDEQPLINLEIEGYTFEHIPTKTQCGGVGIYISNEFDYEIIKEYSICYPNTSESIFVELKNQKSKNLTVGTIYRHHTPVTDFLDIFFTKFLQQITKSRKTCVLCGDFNVDLTQYGNNSIVGTFFDEISSYSFRPLILQPTRVTSRSFTLIDNIFTNNISCHTTGGNIVTSISDHYSQFCHLDLFHNSSNTHKIKFSRDWKNFNKQRFAYELSNLSWDDITADHVTTNTSTNRFYNSITELLDQMAPIKKLNKKERGLVERPWITFGILNSINSRDNLHKDFLKENDPNLKASKFEAYKLKRNLLTTLIRQSKKDYYSKFFLENQSNLKKTWEGIRNLININKKSNVSIEK